MSTDAMAVAESEEFWIGTVPARWIREGYAATSDGRIWSFWTCTGPKRGNRQVLRGVPRELSPSRNAKGYLTAKLGRHSSGYVHRLVWAAWYGPIPLSMQVRHLDGDPSNNRLENLACGTAVENAADKRRHETVHFGAAAHRAQMKASDVYAARRLAKSGVSLDKIVMLLGMPVSKATVADAVNGKTWSNLPDVDSDEFTYQYRTKPLAQDERRNASGDAGTTARTS